MSNIIKLVKKYWSICLYLFFGGLTTLINLAVFNCLYTWAHIMTYQLATFIAWLLSVVFAYITNKLYVFGSHRKTAKETWREAGAFFFFRILSLLIDFAFLQVGIGILHKDPFWTKILDNIFVVIANYFFSKVFIF